MYVRLHVDLTCRRWNRSNTQNEDISLTKYLNNGHRYDKIRNFALVWYCYQVMWKLSEYNKNTQHATLDIIFNCLTVCLCACVCVTRAEWNPTFTHMSDKWIAPVHCQLTVRHTARDTQFNQQCSACIWHDQWQTVDVQQSGTGPPTQTTQQESADAEPASMLHYWYVCLPQWHRRCFHDLSTNIDRLNTMTSTLLPWLVNKHRQTQHWHCGIQSSAQTTDNTVIILMITKSKCIMHCQLVSCKQLLQCPKQ